MGPMNCTPLGQTRRLQRTGELDMAGKPVKLAICVKGSFQALSRTS